MIRIGWICCFLICLTHLGNGQHESNTDPRIGKFDTLTLFNYLNIFDAPFTREFNLNKIHENSILKTYLSFSVNTQLQNLKLKLTNGEIMSPNIYGWAYSFRRISSIHFWLIYYFEGEVGTYLCLRILNIKKKSLSEPYILSKAGGDEGEWEYSFGRFSNDSTYKYLYVHGSEEKTIDSISRQDRIRLNGDVIKISEKILK